MKLVTWIFWPALISAAQAASIQAQSQDGSRFGKHQNSLEHISSLIKTALDAEMDLVKESLTYTVPAEVSDKVGSNTNGKMLHKVKRFLQYMIPIAPWTDSEVEGFIDAWYWILKERKVLFFKSQSGDDNALLCERFKHYREYTKKMRNFMLDLTAARIDTLEKHFPEATRILEDAEKASMMKHDRYLLLDKVRGLRISRLTDKLEKELGSVSNEVHSANMCMKRMDRLGSIANELFPLDSEYHSNDFTLKLKECRDKLEAYKDKYKGLVKRHKAILEKKQ